jgi:hypothetical protein
MTNINFGNSATNHPLQAGPTKVWVNIGLSEWRSCGRFILVSMCQWYSCDKWSLAEKKHKESVDWRSTRQLSNHPANAPLASYSSIDQLTNRSHHSPPGVYKMALLYEIATSQIFDTQ